MKNYDNLMCPSCDSRLYKVSGYKHFKCDTHRSYELKRCDFNNLEFDFETDEITRMFVYNAYLYSINYIRTKINIYDSGNNSVSFDNDYKYTIYDLKSLYDYMKSLMVKVNKNYLLL